MMQSLPVTLSTPKPKRDAELSALLSLSAGSGTYSVGRATPRSILSNRSKTTQQQGEELEDLLSYIDGITFVTPHKPPQQTRKELFTGENQPASTARNSTSTTGSTSTSTSKKPTLTSIMKSTVLGDKTNVRSVNFKPSVFLAKSSKSSTSTAFSTPARFSHRLLRDPTPSRAKSFPQDPEDVAESVPFNQTPWASPPLPTSLINHSTSPFTLTVNTDTPASQVDANVDESLIVELSNYDENQDDRPLWERDPLFHTSPEGNSNSNSDSSKQSPHQATPDPPVVDSRILSPSQEPTGRELSAIDPEPTYLRPQALNESVIMSSPLVDRDLLQHRDLSHLTTHFDQTSFSERLDHDLDHDSAGHSTGSGIDIEIQSSPYCNDCDFDRSFQPLIQQVNESIISEAPTASVALDMDVTAIQSFITTSQPKTPHQARELLKTAMNSLQEARSERETARQWANDMKEAVTKWAEEQRKLIHHETTNRIGALEEREHQLRIQTLTLENLQALMQQLQENFHSSAKERKESEGALKELILEQQDRIENLSRQLESMEQTVSEGMSVQHRLTPKSSASSVSQNPPPTQRRRGGSAFPKFVGHNADDASFGGGSQVSTTSSKRTREPLPNGKGYVVKYSNGVQKEVHKDGTTVIRFTNGDIETNFSQSGTIAYFHAADQVLQITTPDKSVLFEYPNGQIERHYPNGTKAILYPDGTKAKVSPEGVVETFQRI